MEFWDALEDSQYLDAVASVRDGPRPICKWEIPTQEQLEQWETRVRDRKTLTSQPLHVQEGIGYEKDAATAEAEVMPLTLDWFVSCPIGFYFFSSFVKDQHNKEVVANSDDGVGGADGNTSENGDKSKINDDENGPESEHKTPEKIESKIADTTNGSSMYSTAAPGKASPSLANQHAFFRMNFLEELLRLQNLKEVSDSNNTNINSSGRHVGKILLKFVQIPEVDEDTGEIDAPKMTRIRECDLHLPRRLTTRQLGCLTQKEVEAAFAMNYDASFKSNLVGLKGPLLQDFVVAIKDWIQNTSSNHRRIKKAESEPAFSDHGFMTLASDLKEPQTWEEQLLSEAFKFGKSESLTISNNSNHNKEDTDPTDPAGSPRILRRGQTDPDEMNHVRHSMQGGGSTAPSTTLFSIVQKVQAIIYESLKRDYAEAFKANSKQYNRMRNFFWYQDRRVVYDDFYVMRVLGRGGFGLVSGMWCKICPFGIFLFCADACLA